MSRKGAKYINESGPKKCIPINLNSEGFWSHLVDLDSLWCPQDFEGVRKSNISVKNQHKIQKKGLQEGVLEKHDFWIFF